MISSPLWLLFAAAIKLEDGGPVFYSQERVGFGGRTFEALKFRSMRTDAESGVGAVQAVEDDPRVTRVGRLMRATAMDELPQLWNIFRGDMSFVGPARCGPARSMPTARGSCRSIRFRAMRRARRCGPASRASRRSTRRATCPRRQKFRYDRLYVKQQSMWLDLRLILLSFWISFLGTWESRGRKY